MFAQLLTRVSDALRILLSEPRMPKPIDINSVLTAYRTLAEHPIARAAGSNAILSKKEQKDLTSPWAEAAQAERSSGAARLTVASVVSRATKEAAHAWALVNQASGSGSTLLSEKELAALTKQSPFIGATTLLAVRDARALAENPAADLAKSARAFVESYLSRVKNSEEGSSFHSDGLPAGARLDVRPAVGDAAQRAKVPAAVLTAFDSYHRMENADWGSASLHKGRVAGHDVYLVFASTDGDDGYLELFNDQGLSVISARLNAGDIVAWDEFPGRARLSHNIVERFGNTQRAEGFSDDSERLAADQILSTWQPDVSMSRGEMSSVEVAPDVRFLGTTTLDAVLTEPQRALAFAALDILFVRSLRNRVDQNGTPLQLEDQGTLRLGTFTNATGETLLVADWKDIDDDSRTLYFRQGANGLELVVDQYNN
jgi:hypothetical protein